MAKRRIYEIAKERGMATPELAELLRAAGVEVRSNLSSVEQSDVERVLGPAKAAKPGEPSVSGPEGKRTPKKAEPVPAPGSEAKAPERGEGAKRAHAALKVAESGSKDGAAATVGAEAATQKAGSSMPTDAGPQVKEGEKEHAGDEQAKPRPERSQTARKPPRPRARRPRLEDIPTVVGPGVPLRKGVKAPDTVHVKGQEPPKKPAAPKKERPAGAKAAHAKPGDPARPAPKADDSRERSSASGPSRSPAEGHGRPPKTAAGPGAVAEKSKDEAEGATSATGGRRLPAAGRQRRGDDRQARRRVVIDSQAGRKGGKPGVKGERGARPAEAEKAPQKRKAPPGTESAVILASGATVKAFADAFEIGAGEIIKKLMLLGDMVTITESLSDDAIMILAEDYERQVEIKHAEEEALEEHVFEDDPADLVERAPVVTVMGHVDHGKTSLLDAVRETAVVATEAGGITQHIGAYRVIHNGRTLTFIDTPGHEAFTAMRARGAKVTDIAVIVVAANDGVMPQTEEAISHARAAEVPMVVAINKIDIADSNPDRVKQQLADRGLIPEDWGGDTVMVEVSAKKRVNLEELMDMILLVADVQELTGNPKAPASGYIIEAQLDIGRGPVATLLVQRGTLRVGDAIFCGEAFGRVKAMFDFTGESIKEAGPAVPVQILGFNTVPTAGDFAQAVKDEKEARQRAEGHTARIRMEEMAKTRAGATTLEEFYQRLKEGEVKELALVIKGDVHGSVEALEEALARVSHPEAKVVVIHSGVGGVNESDIRLASASNGVVIGFNVRPSVAAKSLADQEGVEVRTYRVIYKAIEDVEAALVGMLEPEYVEEDLGAAEIRQIFKASRIGTIAGCYVQSGKITRNAKVRVVRGGSIVFEGGMESLKRFAEDVKEVATGYECGIHLDGFDDLKEGDMIEAYQMKEVARTK